MTEEGEASSIRTGLVLRPATSCLVLNSSPGFLQFYDPVSGLLSEEVRVDSCDMFVCYPSVCSSVICLFVCVVGCGWAELCLQNRSEADSAHVSGPRQLHTVRRLDGYCKQCSPPPLQSFWLNCLHGHTKPFFYQLCTSIKRHLEFCMATLSPFAMYPLWSFLCLHVQIPLFPHQVESRDDGVTSPELRLKFWKFVTSQQRYAHSLPRPLDHTPSVCIDTWSRRVLILLMRKQSPASPSSL